MGYSLDAISANCYPDTTVLINKFDIRNEEKLSEVESVLSSARYAEWISNPGCSTFDLTHYKAVHKHLFSDLYDWAGEWRTVDISKKGTTFCASKQLGERGERIFQRLRKKNFFQNLSHEAFVSEIVDFYCVTNAWHPFREGNGRTQRLFLAQLIEHAGYHINFADMDTDLLMIATIQASQGVTDLLVEIFTAYIT